jgi:hypothetical protein
VYLASSSTHADHEAWLIDSGASFHMNPHREWFYEYEKCNTTFFLSFITLIPNSSNLSVTIPRGNITLTVRL